VIDTFGLALLVFPPASDRAEDDQLSLGGPLGVGPDARRRRHTSPPSSPTWMT
jgi:hypothetical protein